MFLNNHIVLGCSQQSVYSMSVKNKLFSLNEFYHFYTPRFQHFKSNNFQYFFTFIFLLGGTKTIQSTCTVKGKYLPKRENREVQHVIQLWCQIWGCCIKEEFGKTVSAEIRMD